MIVSLSLFGSIKSPTALPPFIVKLNWTAYKLKTILAKVSYNIHISVQSYILIASRFKCDVNAMRNNAFFFAPNKSRYKHKVQTKSTTKQIVEKWIIQKRLKLGELPVLLNGTDISGN